MDETLYLQAKQNRERRDSLQRTVEEVKGVMNRVGGNGTQNPMLFVQRGGKDGPSGELPAGIVWMALQAWCDKTRVTILELDTQFNQL